jgi:hypothetical protein
MTALSDPKVLCPEALGCTRRATALFRQSCRFIWAESPSSAPPSLRRTTATATGAAGSRSRDALRAAAPAPTLPGVPTDAGLPGFTAFMQAAWKGKLETAQQLLAAGADPNAVSITGKTALAYAREEKRAEVVAWLESLGARE